MSFSVSKNQFDKDYGVRIRLDKQIQIYLKILQKFHKLYDILIFTNILNCTSGKNYLKISLKNIGVPDNYPINKGNLIRINNKRKFGKFTIFQNYLPGANKDIIFVNVISLINKTIMRNSKYL